MDIEQEFVQEALELLGAAEDSLMEIEKGFQVEENYKVVFRSFHSLKGGAGMLGLEDLQRHMHLLEDFYSTLRGKNKDLTKHSDYFLKGIDYAKLLLEGDTGFFDYYTENSRPDRIDDQCILQKFITLTKPKIAHLGKGHFSKNENIATINFFPENNVDQFFEQKKWLKYDAVFTCDQEVIDRILRGHIQFPVFIESLDDVFKCHNLINVKGINPSLFVNLISCSAKFIRCLNDFEKSIQLVMYQFVDLEEFGGVKNLV